MAPVLAADDGTAVGLDCWLGSSADTESVDHGGEVMAVGTVWAVGGRLVSGEHSVEDMDGGGAAAERWGIGVVGFGVDADGVVAAEFDADGFAEADDDVVLGGHEEDGTGRDPEDVALLVTLEEFGGAVEMVCEPADRVGAQGVGSEDGVMGRPELIVVNHNVASGGARFRRRHPHDDRARAVVLCPRKTRWVMCGGGGTDGPMTSGLYATQQSRRALKRTWKRPLEGAPRARSRPV